MPLVKLNLFTRIKPCRVARQTFRLLLVNKKSAKSFLQKPKRNSNLGQKLTNLRFTRKNLWIYWQNVTGKVVRWPEAAKFSNTVVDRVHGT